MAKLRPRARIIRTIGDQLISGPEAALIELVKNAYDADSPSFSIKITPPSAACPLGGVFVSDNGHGMSYNDVLGRWFEPATDDKMKRPYSPGGRRMLGAKGIGRFAASRLGTKTVLQSINGSVGKCEKILVQVDWDEFSPDRYLEDIDVPVLRQDVTSEQATGVSLSITDLRDSWSKKQLSNLIRELRRVLVPDEADNSFQIFLDLKEFSNEVVGFDGPTLVQELNIDTSLPDGEGGDNSDSALGQRIVPFRLHDHADYRVSGRFDDAGNFDGTFVVSRGDNVEQHLSVLAPPLVEDEIPCGPIDLQVNIYDRESESIEDLFRRMGLNFSDIGIRAARQILTDNAGIAIFRNGFRIRPYGEPENDWLELERMRVQDPSRKLGLSQMSGRVGISAERTSGLVERSSREGLEHSGEFDRLKKLIRNVLTHVEQRRLDFREKAGLSRRRTASVEEVKKIASLRATTSAVTKLPTQYQESVRQAIAKDISALTASLEEMDEYQKLLQSRASLGLVVAQVIHEGRRILNPMASAAKALYEQRDWVLEQTKRGEVFRTHFPQHASTVQEGARSMSRLFKRLDPVSGRRRGRPAVFSLREPVMSAVGIFSDTIAVNNIEILLDGIEADKAYGYVADFQAALLNVLENAIHWLTTTTQSQKIIRILTKNFGSQVRVAVINNGPLIDENYIDRLFQPGFSLKSDGTGLGLSIAREACRASKGDLVYLEGAPETCFMILFPYEYAK